MTDDSTHMDDTLRGHHRASLEQLSPRVRAQLAQRRHAALRGPLPHRRFQLGYAAAGVAAVCALAVGIQVRTPPSQPVSAAASGAAATVTPASTYSTVLDQDPDFYAWLASSDAMQVAME